MQALFGQSPATQPARQQYEVQLEVFSGPLDLLLHLIERRELDITVVSLAAVTGQYLAYLESLPEPDPDHLADFLVIAAKLLAIKAMSLLARPPEETTSEEDDGEDLVRMLREYQLFQRVAGHLKAWDDAQRRAYPRAVPVAPIRLPIPDGLSLEDLVVALRPKIPATAEEPALPPLPALQYTIEDRISAIEEALAAVPVVAFRDLAPPRLPLLGRIVTFLALLQLLKDRRIAVEQASTFGEILISLASP